MSTDSNGYRSKWVPIQMGTNPNGYRSKWVPIQMGTNPNGYRSNAEVLPFLLVFTIGLHLNTSKLVDIGKQSKTGRDSRPIWEQTQPVECRQKAVLYESGKGAILDPC